jgi:hypothetical protein
MEQWNFETLLYRTQDEFLEAFRISSRKDAREKHKRKDVRNNKMVRKKKKKILKESYEEENARILTLN